LRTASAVFRAIGAFGLTVCLIFAAAGRFRLANVQGPFILGVFFVACLFLALFLGRQGSIELDGLTLPGADLHDEDEEIHLPGPSWYPAAYGVAAFVLVLGLVMDRRVLVAGGVLVVLTTIGWALESVKDYRREIAHAAPAHGRLPSTAAIELAHRVVAFGRVHGGTDAVVQHLGRGRAELVLVGGDGAWGSLVAPSVEAGREACALASATVHESWPAGLGARVRTGADVWREMGGESALTSPAGHDAPRDGNTQVAAKVFLWLAFFALLADLLFSVTNKFSRTTLQGTAILTAFALACCYLFIGLKNAKARPEDAAYAGDDNVTVEPSEPEPPIDLETLHLPGPSWWPAFFSVALGLLVWGLVYNRTVLLAGVALTVVCCVGWALESVREYRQSISGHH
jgi:hypothetical protein